MYKHDVHVYIYINQLLIYCTVLCVLTRTNAHVGSSIVLVEEALHHVSCMKPYQKYTILLVQDFPSAICLSNAFQIKTIYIWHEMAKVVFSEKRIYPKVFARCRCSLKRPFAKQLKKVVPLTTPQKHVKLTPKSPETSQRICVRMSRKLGSMVSKWVISPT